MTSFNDLHAFAASRGEGLHQKLYELMLRSAASPFPDVVRRHDGMLQAGTDPVSDTYGTSSNMVVFPKDPRGTPGVAKRAREK